MLEGKHVLKCFAVNRGIGEFHGGILPEHPKSLVMIIDTSSLLESISLYMPNKTLIFVIRLQNKKEYPFNRRHTVPFEPT